MAAEEQSIWKKLHKELIERRLKRLRKKLKVQEITILANNCNGTFMYHDLQLRFDSPTINLFLSIQDYLKFVENLEQYLQTPLKQQMTTEVSYPVGKLSDITLHFVHYKSFEEAKQKWEMRKKRIHRDKLCLVMNEGKGCTYEDLQRFDKLPVPHKVVFTHRDYPEIKSAFPIKGFENQKSCDYLFTYMPGSTKRFYEQFDYVEFLNKMA